MQLMSDKLRTILRFGIVGLLVGVVCGIYAAMVDSSHGVGLFFGLISLVACPPQLLFAFCIDCEVTGWGGLIMYSIIAVLNFVLYSVFGFFVTSLRKHSRPTDSRA